MDEFLFLIEFFLTLLLGFIFGVSTMNNYTVFDSDIKQRCIELNRAQYNSINGNFEFTDKEIKYIVTGEK